MGRYNTRPKREKTSAGLWILLAAAAALTVSLAVYLVVSLLLVRTPAKPGAHLDREIYTQEDRWEYWRGFDATVLAAVVCDAYPNANECILAEGADEIFLALTVDGDKRLHFSLRSANMTFHGGYTGYDRGVMYTSRVYEDVNNPHELALYYPDHLQNRGARVSGCIQKDVDGDGEIEYVYLVQDMMDSWLAGGDGTAEELDACAQLMNRTACIYLDAEDKTLYVHSFCLPDSVGEVTDALWDNGMLHLTHDRGVYRLFVSEPALCLRNYGDEADTLRRLCARFALYLEDQGYTDVRMRLADVSLVPGQEILCCYSDGSEYTLKVYSACYGQFRELFSRRGSEGSVYLVIQEDGQYLLDYSQSISSVDYSLTYGYRLFSFDETHNPTVMDADSLWVGSEQGGGQAGSDFFRKINGYLDSGTVCYDPYGLTGYSLMQGDINQPTDPRYLNITNCSTNKVGVITLRDDDSWLHLRSGPSTKHDIVLIDPNDEDSSVKQVQGSLVTVLMPHNTGDRNNPIWVQIQISYQNRTMVGCSSQRYIRIEGIRHLEPGDQFTIEVDNYDTALIWSSSDESVASIDPISGTMTAHRSGLVLITVRSEAGLEDSCLIMVD